MTANFPGPTGNHYTVIDNEPVVSLSNNLYYGIGNYSPCANCPVDQNNLNNQDPLFVDPANLDLELQTNSPAIGAGTANLVFEVAPPSYAPIDRDMKFLLRNAIPSLGAYESTTTVSLEETVRASDLFIYPNPSQGRFRVGFEANTPSEIGFEVFDLLGKQIFATEPGLFSNGDHQTEIDIPNLTSGIYFLRMVVDGQGVRTERFVVE